MFRKGARRHFSKFKDKRLEFGMLLDSQHLGAVAYLKAYVNTRFLKRFPITTNFMHPKLDSQIERFVCQRCRTQNARLHS